MIKSVQFKNFKVLRDATLPLQEQVRPRSGRSGIKIAIGVAVPAIEAWCQMMRRGEVLWGFDFLNV